MEICWPITTVKSKELGHNEINLGIWITITLDKAYQLQHSLLTQYGLELKPTAPRREWLIITLSRTSFI